jgi:hypothetical protein
MAEDPDRDRLWNWIVAAFIAVIGAMTLAWAVVLFDIV